MHPLITRLLPLLFLAAAGLAFSGWMAFDTVHQRPAVHLRVPLPVRPYADAIAATGVIEVAGEITAIGVPQVALITDVAVAVGDRVRQGDVLLRLDDRLERDELATTTAELAVARAQLDVARAGLARLTALPRAEEALPFAARVAVAEAQLTDARTHLARSEELLRRQVTSAAEADVRRGATRIAEAELAATQVELGHARLGAWQPDLAMARAEVVRAEAQVAAIVARVAAAESRLARLVIRAPRAATVLSRTAMVGGLAEPGDRTLLRLGETTQLEVRIEVDESEAARLRVGAAATAWIRGDPEHAIALRFIRFEPEAHLRSALTGQPGERNDARIIQLLYAVVDPLPHLRPGVLIEVDIDAGPITPGGT